MLFNDTIKLKQLEGHHGVKVAVDLKLFGWHNVGMPTFTLLNLFLLLLLERVLLTNPSAGQLMARTLIPPRNSSARLDMLRYPLKKQGGAVTWLEVLTNSRGLELGAFFFANSRFEQGGSFVLDSEKPCGLWLIGSVDTHVPVLVDKLTNVVYEVAKLHLLVLFLSLVLLDCRVFSEPWETVLGA